MKVAIGSDKVFRMMLRAVSSIFPDVERYNLKELVAAGFDISWTEILLVDNLLPLAGYLLPWLVLAYYLIKWREVASSS